MLLRQSRSRSEEMNRRRFTTKTKNNTASERLTGKVEISKRKELCCGSAAEKGVCRGSSAEKGVCCGRAAERDYTAVEPQRL